MFELPTAVLLISVLLIWGSPLRFVIVSDIPLAGYTKGIDCGGGLLGKSPSYPWTWLIKADLEVQPCFFPKGTVPQYPSLSCPEGMRKQINRIEPIQELILCSQLFAEVGNTGVYSPYYYSEDRECTGPVSAERGSKTEHQNVWVNLLPPAWSFAGWIFHALCGRAFCYSRQVQ